MMIAVRMKYKSRSERHGPVSVGITIVGSRDMMQDVSVLSSLLNLIEDGH